MISEAQIFLSDFLQFGQLPAGVAVGATEVQLNLIATRLLGLPRE